MPYILDCSTTLLEIRDKQEIIANEAVKAYFKTDPGLFL